jgi:hypothetical protein
MVTKQLALNQLFGIQWKLSSGSDSNQGTLVAYSSTYISSTINYE